MSQLWSDIYTYGLPFVTGAAGIICGHKAGFAKALKVFEKRLGAILAGASIAIPKAEEIGGHVFNAIKELVKIPAVATVAHHVEAKAEKALEDSHTTQLVNFALVGLIKVGKHLSELTDAEKYGIAQFILGSIPADLRGSTTESDIVSAISEAQKLLDAGNANTVLNKVLELTGLAQAFANASPPDTAPAADVPNTPQENTQTAQ